MRHLISFLRWRFSLLPAGAYRYSDEELDSEIAITSDTPINPERVGRRPAISVLRAHGAYQGVGIGDVAYTDLATGAQAYMDLFPTTLVVNVLSKLPLEADRLAMFCSKQIRARRDQIITTLPELLYLGQRIGISPPSPAGSLVQSTDYEWSVVALTIPTFLQDTEHIYPINKPALRSFGLAMETARPPTPPAPAVPLQGTAVQQAQMPRAQAASGASDHDELRQPTTSEASSSEPLVVNIKT